jgi:hypothetical protein
LRSRAPKESIIVASGPPARIKDSNELAAFEIFENGEEIFVLNIHLETLEERRCWIHGFM